MKSILVSIILPTYNRANYLERAIKSVLDQSFQEWELIVVDDASTDATFGILEKWQKKDGRIKMLRNEKNNYLIDGISKNLNNGISIAKGKYIARLDDDDCWCHKNKLKMQVDFLENNTEYVIVGGGMIVIDGLGKEKFRYFKKESDQEIRAGALLSSPFSHTTVMFLKSAAEKVGFYGNEKLAEDWNLWLKLGKLGKFYNFPEYFTYYMMDGNNKSLFHLRQHAKIHIDLASRHRNEYPGFYMACFLGSAQYLYSFSPMFLRRYLDYLLSKIKRSI